MEVVLTRANSVVSVVGVEIKLVYKC